MHGDTTAGEGQAGRQGAEKEGQGGECDEDMLDVDTPASMPATPVFPTPPTLSEDSEDFTDAEWQTIALGWRDFQNDLRHAAQSGVRVWRMKVCVLTTVS